MSQVKGKIVYIEPNNLYQELGVHLNNGDNINWEPENLGISVDLQVIVADRDNCGKTAICDDFTFNVSSNNAKDKYWQSFLNGENLSGEKDKEELYLTDNYTDVSYQEILNNNAGSKEALGIQSIDISFDSHFFPIVKIKMIDVRGFSLMMPAEQGYLDSLEKKAEICNNFFSTLFHFPYPRFALSVKGHYGDRVTFMLSVNDFQSSFNSQTGNFEVDIEFIGHMYGLYSDIPLNYLLCAPYMGTDGYTVNQYWRNNATPGGPFTFSDGTSIPTLVEFLGKYENMAETFQQNYSFGNEDTQNIDKITKIRENQKLLSQALVEYSNILNDIGKGNTISKIDTSNYVLYFVKESSINLPSTKKLEELVKAYNDESSQTVSYPISLNPESWGFAKEAKPSLFNQGEINENHEYYKTIKGLANINEKLNSLSEEIKGRNTFLFTKEIEFIDNIRKAMSNDDANVNSLLSNSESELRAVTKTVLGFVPTIENIYRMIYAHIDCFLSSFYSLLSNINAHKDQRILSKIGNIDISETDVEANGTNEFNIPPFTAFFEKEENNRTRKYPGEIPWLRNLDEVIYVEMLFSSINTVKNTVNEMSVMHQQQQIEDAVQEEPEQKKKDVSWKPLSFIDYYYDKNPYSYLAVEDSNDFLGYLLYFYKVRMAGANIITDNRNFSNKKGNIKDEIIKNEANNVIAEHSNFLLNNPSLKDKLKECSENTSKASSFISEFLGKYANLKDNFYDNSEEFPIIFRNIKNGEIDRMLSSFEGHNIIKNSLNTETSYVDFDNIKNVKDLSCEYKTDNNFKGGIYRINDSKFKEVQFNNTNVKAIRNNNYKDYYFPILQVDEKEIKNLYTEGFFNDDIEKLENEGLYKKAMIFLSTMVGNNNVYKFDKSNSSILRVPKHLALYFGGLKCAGEKPYKGEKKEDKNPQPFWINNNGVYTENNKGKLYKLNEYEFEEFIAEDKNGGLSTYFKEWVAGEFKTLYTTIKNAEEKLEEHKEITKKNKKAICFENGGEVSNLLLKFYTDTIDIFKVKTRKNDFNDENLKLFARELYNYIVNNETNTGNTASEEEFTISGEANNNALMVKNSIYYTLKNLYDKWISTYTINTFRLKAPNEDKAIARQKSNGEIINSSIVSEFDSFVFIDTFYNDISDRFLINPEAVYSLINPQTKGETNRSCLQFMTDIAQKSDLLFVALPVFNNFYDANSIANIFTPQNLYDGSKKNARGIGNTYVLMYTHEPSHNLNTMKDSKNSTGYDSDGLDIADTAGEILPTAVSAFNNAGYTIPAFGVTFAKQNQMYFKGLTLNMSNPRETDYAIYNRFKLAAQETNGATNAPSPIGQDMFSIYSNRVYDCGVEMMGCANIMPMMYFQLNNVPMYKGAYMITNVKHHIENGSMTTSFSGTRISKNAIPFNQNVIDVESLISKINGGANEENGNGTIITGEVQEGNKYSYNGDVISANDISQTRIDSTAVFNVAKANAATKSSINGKVPYNSHSSSHLCATFTKKIVQAGFAGTELDKYISGNAYACRNIMPQLNFKPIAKITDFEGLKDWNTTKMAEPGDVAVMNHGTYGHICYFTGESWISDFNQEECTNGLWPYQSTPYVYIFRYAGDRIMPSYYHKIKVNAENVTIIDRETEKEVSDEFSIIGDTEIKWKITRTDGKKAQRTQNNLSVQNVIDNIENAASLKFDTKILDEKGVLDFDLKIENMSGDVIINIR